MTRKDYVRLAAAINLARETRAVRTEDPIDVVADCIALALAGDNPLFNREKFLTATRHSFDHIKE